MADIIEIEKKRKEVLDDLKNLVESNNEKIKSEALYNIFGRFLKLLKGLEELFKGKDEFVKAARKSQFKIAEIQAEIHKEKELSLEEATIHIHSLKEAMSKEFLGVHIWKEFRSLIKGSGSLVDLKYEFLKNINKNYEEILKNIEPLKEIKTEKEDIGKNIERIKGEHKATEKPLKELEKYIKARNQEAVERGFTWLFTVDSEILKSLRDKILKPIFDELKGKVSTITDYSIIFGEKAYVGKAVITSKGGIFFNYIESIDKFQKACDEVTSSKIKKIYDGLSDEQKKEVEKELETVKELKKLSDELKKRRDKLKGFEDNARKKKESLFKELREKAGKTVKNFDKLSPGFEILSREVNKDLLKRAEKFFNELKDFLNKENVKKIIKEYNSYSRQSPEDLKNEAEIFKELLVNLNFFEEKIEGFLAYMLRITKIFVLIAIVKLNSLGFKLDVELIKNKIKKPEFDSKELSDMMKRFIEIIPHIKEERTVRDRALKFFSTSFVSNIIELVTDFDKLLDDYKTYSKKEIEDQGESKIRESVEKDTKKIREEIKKLDEQARKEDILSSLETYKEFTSMINEYLKMEVSTYEMTCRHLKKFSRHFDTLVDDLIKIADMEKKIKDVGKEVVSKVKDFVNRYYWISKIDVKTNNIYDFFKSAKDNKMCEEEFYKDMGKFIYEILYFKMQADFPLLLNIARNKKKEDEFIAIFSKVGFSGGGKLGDSRSYDALKNKWEDFKKLESAGFYNDMQNMVIPKVKEQAKKIWNLRDIFVTGGKLKAYRNVVKEAKEQRKTPPEFWDFCRENVLKAIFEETGKGLGAVFEVKEREKRLKELTNKAGKEMIKLYDKIEELVKKSKEVDHTAQKIYEDKKKKEIEEKIKKVEEKAKTEKEKAKIEEEKEKIKKNYEKEIEEYKTKAKKKWKEYDIEITELLSEKPIKEAGKVLEKDLKKEEEETVKSLDKWKDLKRYEHSHILIFIKKLEEKCGMDLKKIIETFNSNVDPVIKLSIKNGREISSRIEIIFNSMVLPRFKGFYNEFYNFKPFLVFFKSIL